MTDRVDLLIRARFDAVANPSDDRDWADVLARAQGGEVPVEGSARRRRSWRRMPARVALVAAVVVLAAVATAAAFGWPQRVVDFFSSAPAPTHVKNSFRTLGVDAPPGMDPRAIAGQTRRIATVRFPADGPGDRPSLHTLYIAPTKTGDFCYLWTGIGGGCEGKPSPHHGKAGPLGLDWMFGSSVYPTLVGGTIAAGATRTVEARFADGTTATIPVTWVSAPITAGFVEYPVPSSHQDRADALTSVVALDANGKVIGRERPDHIQQRFVQRLPDGTKDLLPRGAETAKARKIISFRATDGVRVVLWLMPYRGGGTCISSTVASGCSHGPTYAGRLVGGTAGPAHAGGIGGGTPTLFFSETSPAVATIELRYQNGERERLTPIDGFVLHEITPAHYRLGTRLVAAIGLNRNGKANFTLRFRPREGGFYPCQKPVNHICP